MDKYSQIAELARRAIWRRFRETSAIPLDDHGYVGSPGENMLAGLRLADFEEEIGRGGGSELKPRARNGHQMKPKFRAAHSSCALAVNAFGPLKKTACKWDWPEVGITGLGAPRFEAKLGTGIKGSLANLDVLFDTGQVLLGIESKFTEYLKPGVPEIASAFPREKLDVEPCWWARLHWHRDVATPQKRLLDEAQLIKHYLGLRRAVGTKGEYPGRSVVLLYLYWEPLNASEFEVFAEHRAEVEVFGKAVSDSQVRFLSMTYQTVWDAWARRGFLVEHVQALQRRYNLRLTA